MSRRILLALAVSLVLLVPVFAQADPPAPLPPVPGIPGECMAQLPFSKVNGAGQPTAICQYSATTSHGQWQVFTPSSWTITVKHAGSSKLAAQGSLTNPNLFGTFTTAPGDVVTVRLYSICASSAFCGSFGTILAGDSVGASPPAFPALPGAPSAVPSGSPSPSPSPSKPASPVPSTNECVAQPAAQKMTGGGQFVGLCEYSAENTVGGFVAATPDSFTITVSHKGKHTVVASGSSSQPTPQGTFSTAAGDRVTVRLYSICLAPGNCGSFGSVHIGDRPAATPQDPQAPNVPGGPSTNPTPNGPPSVTVPPQPASCLAQSFFQRTSGSGQPAAICAYKATGTTAGWNVFTPGSWTIAVKHGNVSKTVAWGNMTNPNAFGSFATAVGDLVTVRIYTFCVPGNAFCGTAGTVFVGDRPSQVPNAPAFPQTPAAPGVPATVPSAAPTPPVGTGAATLNSCVAQPLYKPLPGAGLRTATCQYTAATATGGFLAPTIGSWTITTRRSGKTITLASGSATGATPQGTYTTVPGDTVVVNIYSICTPGTKAFCGSIGGVAASDR